MLTYQNIPVLSKYKVRMYNKVRSSARHMLRTAGLEVGSGSGTNSIYVIVDSICVISSLIP